MGVTLFNRDSGKIVGHAQSRRGRAQLRGVLYMCTLVATRRNPVPQDLDQIDAAADPVSEYAEAVYMLHLSVESIHAYWPLPIEKLERPELRRNRRATGPVRVQWA